MNTIGNLRYIRVETAVPDATQEQEIARGASRWNPSVLQQRQVFEF